MPDQLKRPHKSKRLAKIAQHSPLDQPSIRNEFYIEDEMMEQISFYEELDFHSVETKKKLGKVTISVTNIGPENQYFQIRSTAQANDNGVVSGIRIISVVDRNFATIEEEREEYSTPGEMAYPIKKSLYVGQDGDAYHCSLVHRHIQDEHVDKKITRIPCAYAKNFVGEGANLLFLRYLAMRGEKVNVYLLGMKMDGHLCFAHYTCAGIDRKKSKMSQPVTVKRNIKTTEDAEERMTTVLSALGQQLKHTWEDESYYYSIHQSQKPVKVIDNGVISYVIPLASRWEEDMEMMSNYLDKVVAERASHQSYLLDNPEIRHILSDFVQTLLLQKPDYAFSFAVEYFRAFKYTNEYLEYYRQDWVDDDDDDSNEGSRDSSDSDAANQGLFEIPIFCV